MTRGPMGVTAAGGVVLVAAAGLLGVAVIRAVSVDPLTVDAAPMDAEGVAVRAAPGALAPSEAGEPEGATVEGSAPATEVPPAATQTPPAAVERPRGRGRSRGAPRTGPGPVPEDAFVAAAFGQDALTLAVENDPFSPEREPPAQRYRLPVERVPMATEEPRPERPEPPDLRVVGAVATGRSGAALVQVQRGDPRLLVMGESVEGYTLAAVDAESATLVGPAGRLRLPVVEQLGAAAPEEVGPRRGRGGQGGRAAGPQAAQDRLQQLQQIMRRFQGARGRGGGTAIDIALPPDASAGGRGGRGGGGGGAPSPSDG